MTGEEEQRPLFFQDTRARERSAVQYASSALYLQARRRFYNEYLVPPTMNEQPIVTKVDLVTDPNDMELVRRVLDIERVMTDSLELKGHERILDAGCGDGTYSLWLRRVYGHSGKMVAIDTSEWLVHTAKERFQKFDADIDCLVSDVEDIRKQRREGKDDYFKDGSFDVVTANFLLYHVDNPMNALREIYHVLRPGGKLLVAGREEANMEKLWLFARKCTDYINGQNVAGFNLEESPQERKQIYEPPDSFYRHFNQDMALLLPSNMFEFIGPKKTKDGRLKPFEQIGRFRIPPEGWSDVESVLRSILRDLHTRQHEEKHIGLKQSQIDEAIEAVAKPFFDNETKDKGFFEDRGYQWFAIFRKPEDGVSKSGAQRQSLGASATRFLSQKP